MRDLFDAPAPAPSRFARYGDGSWIVPPCTVEHPEAIAIGREVIILEHSSLRVIAPRDVAPILVIGDGVRLTRFVNIVCAIGVELEDDVASSDAATLFDTWEAPGVPAGLAAMASPTSGPVKIEAGAYLGYGCIVGPGVTVGRGAFVGEGAVVFDDVPAHAVVYGNPARVIRRHDVASGTWIGPRWP
jgi:acetyltransferase-like isoleucine patch superfamily enzyme